MKQAQKDLIGRTIARITWGRHPLSPRKKTLLTIVLDDGTAIYSHGYEVPGDVDSELCYVKPAKRKVTS